MVQKRISFPMELLAKIHEYIGINKEFPEALVKDHIISWSNENDLILDPFAGSGTTLKMAKLLRRNYLGIEISEKYIEIINKRLDKYNNQTLEVFNQ